MNAKVPSASKATPDETDGKLDRHLLKIAMVIVLGSFMSVLDTTIVNVAISSLSRTFNSSLAVIQWVATGYLLALATAIPLTGWGADRFGTKRLYIGSITLFVLGSMLAGAAWSAQSLIVFRILQGFGGGMIIPVGITILTHAAGPKRMGRVMGIVGVTMLLGPLLGPMLGGYFVEYVTWRWIFLINLPIGAVAILAAARILDGEKPKSKDSLDWKGLLLLSPGLGIMVYGVSTLASGSNSGSFKTVAAIPIGILLLVAFIFYALKRERSLINVRIFARREIGASALTTFLFGIVFFGMSFLLPLYFQIIRGCSALDAGLLVSMQGFGAMFTMPIAGKLTDKIGPGKIVLCGLTVAAFGTFALSQITSATVFWQIRLAIFATGLGFGATMMPALTGALGGLERKEVARASSGLNAVLRVGGSIGVALFSVVLSRQVSSLLPPGGGGGVNLSQVREIPADVKALILPQLGAAFGHTFLCAFAVVVMALGAALFLPRKKLSSQSSVSVMPPLNEIPSPNRP